MKTVIRIVVVSLLVALMLPLVGASAQDGGDEDLVVATEISAVYYLGAASGSFAENADGTYALTLENVGEDLIFIVTEPVLSINTISNVNFNDQWAAAEALMVEAVLEVNGLNVALTLSSPAYEDGMQTFVATVDGISALGDIKDPELPMEFEAANLSIAWSAEFQGGLVEGIVALYEGVRATPAECAAAQQTYNDYAAWYAPKIQQQNAAAMTCYGLDGTSDAAVRAAACAEYQALAIEIRTYQTSIQSDLVLLAVEC